MKNRNLTNSQFVDSFTTFNSGVITNCGTMPSICKSDRLKNKRSNRK
jgi:hypothetical protein